ncbi:MAG: iron-containing alcohol dehydrogenase [Azoarcus sp. PHD]|jgi:alcohol dehydrogenase|nr:MAG: iron-containing alcohol dehydrogenase [Azoarcus sp. PHD]
MTTSIFFIPSVNLMGSGCLKDAALAIQSHGWKKALVVTDAPLVRAGLVGRVTELLGDVARAMGCDVQGLDADAAAVLCQQAIRDLAADVDIPAGVGQLGAKEADIPTLAANAMKDACGLTNPVQPSFEEVCAIYRAAL